MKQKQRNKRNNPGKSYPSGNTTNRCQFSDDTDIEIICKKEE